MQTINIALGVDFKYEEPVLKVINGFVKDFQNLALKNMDREYLFNFYIIHNGDYLNDWVIKVNQYFEKLNTQQFLEKGLEKSVSLQIYAVTLNQLMDFSNSFKVNSEKIELNFEFQTASHISQATFYRYFAPYAPYYFNLNVDNEVVLYIDSDTILSPNGLDAFVNLYQEFQKFIGYKDNNLIAGVVNDVGESASNYIFKLLNNVGLNSEVIKSSFSDYPLYFNAGVLLINCELYIQDKLAFKALEFNQKFDDKIQYADQDVLNILFLHTKDYSIMEIPLDFNIQIGCLYNYGLNAEYFSHFQGFPKCQEMFENCFNRLVVSYTMIQNIKQPIFYHYTGPYKPFLLDNDKKDEYLAIASKLHDFFQNNEQLKVIFPNGFHDIHYFNIIYLQS